MTGPQMLLKSFGLDPEKVVSTYNQLTEQLPVFLNALGSTVADIQTRIARIEANQRIIAEKLGVTIDTTESTAVATTNGGSRNAA